MSGSYDDYVLDTTSLPLFVGNVFNLVLYGILTVQLYLYYISFPKDSWLLKTVIYFVYVTETGYTVFLTYDLGHFILAFPKPVTLSPIIIPIFGGIVAFLTQATYAYRIQVLGKLKYIPWCIMALIVIELLAIIVMSPFGIYSGFLMLGWASISLVVDVIIAGAMFWSLRKNKILSKQLKSKVTRLVHLVIGTGALTVAINLLTVLALALMGNAALGPAIVLSKFYANSMMVFVNDRIPSSHSRDDRGMSDMTVALSSLHFATASGPEDAAQEQTALEGGCDDESGTLGQMVEDSSNQRSCPA